MKKLRLIVLLNVYFMAVDELSKSPKPVEFPVKRIRELMLFYGDAIDEAVTKEEISEFLKLSMVRMVHRLNQKERNFQ